MTTPMIDLDSTLAEIVDSDSAAVRVLMRHRLDFCCGGDRTLAAACAEAGLDPAAVRRDLAGTTAVDVTPPWVGLAADDLVDHIESTHHAYLHSELGVLVDLASTVLGVHGVNHPELSGVHAGLVALRDDLEPHLAKEERVLFPLVRALARGEDLPPVGPGSVRPPVTMMMAEHERTGALLDQLRRSAQDFVPPNDACASYRSLYAALQELDADVRLHVHKENNVLFPMAVALETGATSPT